MEDILYEEALAILNDWIKEHPIQPKSETLLLEEVLGRRLAEDVTAQMDQPPFPRSPLDGYTFDAAFVAFASKQSPKELEIVGEICAGEVWTTPLKRGQALGIMTGAPIPAGCNCVLRQEDAKVEKGSIQIEEPLKPYENYCFQGEDIQKGTVIAQKGQTIDAILLGVFASMGVQCVKVEPKIKVAIICTGDEIVGLDEPLAQGKIYNVNGLLLKARLKELGVEVMHMCTCPDEEDLIAQKIKERITSADLILTTGGVSVGRKDILHLVMSRLGAKRLFWRIKMQPGSPFLASQYKNKLILSLSGNPFAALATFELLVRRALAQLSKNSTLQLVPTKGIMESEFLKQSTKKRFVRGKYEKGRVSIPSSNHSSGALFTMSLCNCLIEIEAGSKGLHQGEEVTLYLL